MTTFDSHKWIKLYKESRLNEALPVIPGLSTMADEPKDSTEYVLVKPGKGYVRKISVNDYTKRPKQAARYKDEATARASVTKIRNSSRSHAHKTQAAIAMEQRAKAAGKSKEAAIFRKFIEQQKKKTKAKNKKK